MAIQFVDVADKTTLDAVATNVSSANTDLATLKARGGILYNSTSSKPQVYDVTNNAWVDLDVGGGGGTPTIIVITDSLMQNQNVTVKFRANPTLYTETKNAGTLTHIIYELPWLGQYVVSYTDGNSALHITIVDVIGVGGTVVDELAAIPTFANATDAQLLALTNLHYSNDIDLTSLWSVGDTHLFDSYEYVITDFNHDTLKVPINGHTKAVISVDSLYLQGTRQMNTSNTNTGGWANCAMRSYLNGEFFNSLSTNIQNLIKPVQRITGVGGGATSGTNTTTDKVFLRTEKEIFTSRTYSFEDEYAANTHLSYYDIAANRIKKQGGASGSASYWWESSPYSGNSAYFCYVGSSGSACTGNASYANGLAPAYAI